MILSTEPINPCDCCGEREIFPEAQAHGYQWCEQCSKTTICSQCGERENSSGTSYYDWEKREDICEKCIAKNAAAAIDEQAGEIQDKIAAAAEQLGYEVSRERSFSSEARYLILAAPHTEEDDDYEEIKIRIADHTPRPTYERLYGSADYEVKVTRYGHAAADGDADDCIWWLGKIARKEN